MQPLTVWNTGKANDTKAIKIESFKFLQIYKKSIVTGLCKMLSKVEKKRYLKVKWSFQVIRNIEKFEKTDILKFAKIIGFPVNLLI